MTLRLKSIPNARIGNDISRTSSTIFLVRAKSLLALEIISWINLPIGQKTPDYSARLRRNRRLCPQITQIVADSKPRRGLGEGGFLPRFWAVRAGLAYTARHLPVFSFFASFRMCSGQFNPLKNLCRTHDDTTRNLLATFRVLWRVWRILCFCYPCHRRNPRFGSLYNSKLAQMHRLRAN